MIPFRDQINIWGIKSDYFIGRLKARFLVKKLGEDCRISSKVRYMQPSKILINCNVEVREYSMFDARTSESIGIKVNDGVRIKENVSLVCYSGSIEISESVLIGRNSVILAHGGVKIGEKSMISPNCLIVASNHIYSLNGIDFQDQGFTKQKVEIGRNVWIGGGCKVLGDSIIQDDVVIAAGSVVPGYELESGYLYGGVPVKKIRALKKQEFPEQMIYFKSWDSYK